MLARLCGLFLLLVVAAASAEDEAAEENPYRPGLVATYSAGGRTATRVDETIAFDWQDATTDPRLPAGEFSAVWRGRLWMQAPGTYQLFCFVQGEVEIKLAGKSVVSGEAKDPQWISSQPLELPFDRHAVEITYRRMGQRGQLALFWTGPQYRLEPIAERFLMHEREQRPAAEFERGRQLAAALRCSACHRNESTPVTPAPALDRLSGNVHEAWLVDWLANHAADSKQPLRRMPDLAITREEASAIALWLLREPAIKVELKLPDERAAKAKGKSGKKKGEEEPPRPTAAAGERLLLTRGCLACHQLGELGDSGLFGGGDLSQLAKKRPADFLLRWLSNPAAINRSHRMPQFTSTTDELRSLDLWWQTRSPQTTAAATKNLAGEKLVASLRCANCHMVKREEAKLAAATIAPLTATSNWSRTCAAAPDRAKLRPGYKLAAADQAALKAYYSQPRPGAERLSPQARGRDLLVQLNCLVCHRREGVDRSVVGTLRVPSSAIDAAFANDGTRSVPTTLRSVQERLVAVAAAHGDLAPLVPAMTPPALNGVGDKLLDAALADSIRRAGPPHRPYLLVQMPKFGLTDAQLADLTAYFTATDRIPRGAGVSPALEHAAGETPTPRLLAAGPRLVTADGLACTSCHQVGSVQPVKAPLNARGPDISMPEKRIRREWFDRWCDNPARIVPRMEMPAVKIAVRGVLNENVADQLAAVWHILNTPGFEPPEPNPVRVLRLSGVPERNERPIVIHDVVKDGDKTYLFPLVIGLPNRHNILFDLETNRLAAWWLGDTARQRTKGKSWYWETGSKPSFEPSFKEPEFSVWIDGKERFPEAAASQFVGDFEAYTTSPTRSFLTPPQPARVDLIVERKVPTSDASVQKGGSFVSIGGIDSFCAYDGKRGPGSGFTRVLNIVGHGNVSQVRLRLVSSELAQAGKWDELSHTFQLPIGISIRVFAPRQVVWNGDGTVSAKDEGNEDVTKGFRRLRPTKQEQPTWRVLFNIDYVAPLAADQYVVEMPPPLAVEPGDINIAPGILARRLGLSGEIMPSAFTWNTAGDLIFATLKGEVLRAIDSSGDGSEDSLQTLIDGLATPYGIHATEQGIHVAAKDGLLFLESRDEGKTYSWVQTVASGWGCTDDYHDWAVGLVPGDNGEYFIALPCQQDQRSEAAAKLRGTFLRLSPRKPTPDNSHEFDIEVISAGHRFPMGMARNRDGEMFVTDNQGNYNPFNELNHVRKGAHFGFINALEKEQGFKAPPLTEPAIDIPHPWTRSVNGICFLETPVEWGRRVGPASGASAGPPAQQSNGGPAAAAALSHPTKIFGPLEGQLVGCEYDTRRLIRMSLQKVGETFQGAAYPLSLPTEDVEKGLLGPIVCAVKPTTGELYVGEIRDSGWGAGNNIGQIVKMKIEPDKLPCGIAEVRATATGFTIDFLQLVDRTKAADAANYSLESYRRESTPAYGGPDIDRRIEKVASAEVTPDGKRVTLSLPQLRAGHVYELKLKNLAPAVGAFFPDEAHYTLRKIP